MMDWFIDRIPVWFRDKWPLKPFYWQQEDIDKIKREAIAISKGINWS